MMLPFVLRTGVDTSSRSGIVLSPETNESSVVRSYFPLQRLELVGAAIACSIFPGVTVSMLGARRLIHPFLWPALIASLAVADLCALCVWGVVWHGGVPVDAGWAAVPRGESWLIAEVTTSGPAFGKLQAGDQILSINGDAIAARFAPGRNFADAPGFYSIDISRSGTALHFVLPIRPVPQRLWTLLISIYCLALINLALAVWIAVARPGIPSGTNRIFPIPGRRGNVLSRYS